MPQDKEAAPGKAPVRSKKAPTKKSKKAEPVPEEDEEIAEDAEPEEPAPKPKRAGRKKA